MGFWGFICKLGISNFIQLLAVVVTAISVIASIYMSAKAIKQNSQIYLATNRPQIRPSYEIIKEDFSNTHIVIKNYGNIGGKITEFKTAMAKEFTDLEIPFENIKGAYFAPGQSYRYTYRTKATDKKEFDFNIKYISDDGREFSEITKLKTCIGHLTYTKRT